MNGARLAKTDSATEVTGFIPISIMTQYQSDGFKFVRKIDKSMLNGQVKTPSFDTTNLASRSNIFESLPSNISPVATLMLTSEGYEYTSTHFNFNSRRLTNEISRSTDGYNPDHNHRSLKIIGRDTRSRVPNTTVAPYTFIGALTYAGSNTSVCTGTIISKTAILTAAHCVYDVDNGEFYSHDSFAPGRYVKDSKVIDPYGLWNVSDIFILQAFANATTSNTFFDFAVVIYENRIIAGKNYSIGEYVGHAGLSEATGFADPLLDTSTITGYPTDKGSRSMWTMGQCKSGILNATNYVLKFFNRTSSIIAPSITGFFDCDTTFGKFIVYLSLLSCRLLSHNTYCIMILF